MLMEVHGTRFSTSRRRLIPALIAAAAVVVAAAVMVKAQPARFDDVVRNLRNPDPKVREMNQKEKDKVEREGK